MADPLSTVVNIIDLLCKAKELYETFKDVKGLPEAFETITFQIDVANSIFEKIKNDTSLVSQDTKLQAAVDGCEADARKLQAIYVLMSKEKHERAMKRYWSYVKGVSKDKAGAIEEIWKRLLNGAHLLADRCGLEGLSEIKDAIAELQELPSSLEPARSDIYNNFADTVGVQGHNSGEVTMGNKYMGDHVESHAAGPANVTWLMQGAIFANAVHEIHRKMTSVEKQPFASASQPMEIYSSTHPGTPSLGGKLGEDSNNGLQHRNISHITRPINPSRHVNPPRQRHTETPNVPLAQIGDGSTAQPDTTSLVRQHQGFAVNSRIGGPKEPMMTRDAFLWTRPLDSEYKVRAQPGKFFQVGKVFLTLWADPHDHPGDGRSSFLFNNKDVFRVAYGRSIPTKVRRFIVFRPGDQSCTCLVISTHSGLGATLKSPFEHGIVFTGQQPHQPMSRETQMQPIPIRIDVDQRGTSLDSCSRVHYGKFYTMEHNVKVKPFGVVSPDSVQALNNQFRIVWARMFVQNKPTPPDTQPDQPLEPSARQASSSDAQELPPPAALKASGFHDVQIRKMQTIVGRGMSPKYATAIVRAEASKVSPTQAHEVGRLVVGGMQFPAAFARVTDKAHTGTSKDDDEDEDGDDDNDNEEDSVDDNDDDDEDDVEC